MTTYSLPPDTMTMIGNEETNDDVITSSGEDHGQELSSAVTQEMVWSSGYSLDCQYFQLSSCFGKIRRKYSQSSPSQCFLVVGSLPLLLTLSNTNKCQDSALSLLTYAVCTTGSEFCFVQHHFISDRRRCRFISD